MGKAKSISKPQNWKVLSSMTKAFCCYCGEDITELTEELQDLLIDDAEVEAVCPYCNSAIMIKKVDSDYEIWLKEEEKPFYE
jgi:DNA-directed RNA polymerase subunit RPC12/RpoP